MTNQPRTRAEIQAEIEKLQAQLKETWPKKGDSVYIKARVVEVDDNGHAVAKVANDATEAIEYWSVDYVIPAADLIPRAEHERALEEAKGKPTNLDANTALGYLVKEYDLDTGHMDTVGPRTYPFDHNGHIYEVVVRRKAAAASQPTAVAPKGVVARLLALGDCLKDAEKPWMSSITRAIANEITELPEPSECDYDWRPYFSNGAYCIVITPQMGGTIGVRPHQVPYFIAALIERAALLAKEGTSL